MSIANAPAEIDPDAPRATRARWAASLVASNRLYRRAADRAGHRRIVALLDELEPLLLELAHSVPDGATTGDTDSVASAKVAREELTATQQRIEEKDLLFKLRIAGSGWTGRPPARPITNHTSS